MSNTITSHSTLSNLSKVENVQDLTSNTDVEYPTLETISNSTVHRNLPLTPIIVTTPPASPNSMHSDAETDLDSLAQTNDNDTNYTNLLSDEESKQLVNELYDKLKALTMGTLYTGNNWVLLVNKAVTLVTSPELRITRVMPINDRLDLVCKLVLMYLDTETNIDSELLDTIHDTIPFILNQWSQSYGTNKNQHKTVAKKQRANQKYTTRNTASLVAEDTITPAGIEGLLVDRIETMFTRGKLYDFKNFQNALPEIVVMCIKVVDKYNHLSSTEKRNLIVQTLVYVLNTKVSVWFKLSDNESRRVKLLSDSLPMLVETTTSLVNGELPDKLNFKDVLPLGIECLKITGGLFRNCKC